MSLQKKWATTLSLFPLIICLYIWIKDLHPQIDWPWIPLIGARFALSVDALSLMFMLLTAFITSIAILSTDETKMTRPGTFYGCIFVLQGLLFGFFMATDLFLFAFFWEAMLVPLYLLLANWGDEQRQNTALKFLLYTLSGSVFLVIGILSLYFLGDAQGFSLVHLAQQASSSPYAPYLCGIFLLAFAVKTPLFPFHAWLPDAYSRSLTPVTILLSAVLSKAGIYGFLRIGPSFFFQQIEAWSHLLLTLAIAGVIYGAFAAWMQTDVKRLVAYSSLSHVNFIVAGIFIQQGTAMSGSILQSVNHAFTIAALFLCVEWVTCRIQTSSIHKYGGLCLYMPKLCWFTLFFVLASIGLPGMNNFVGEILILFGFIGVFPWLTPLLATSLVLSAIYMLRWMQQLYFGPPHLIEHKKNDLQPRELFLAITLGLAILVPGIYPAIFLNRADMATREILKPYESPQR